jgi:hypothetical protein
MAVSTPDTSFELNLRSSANKTLWTSIDFDGDRTWILTGMLKTLLGNNLQWAVHEGHLINS